MDKERLVGEHLALIISSSPRHDRCKAKLFLHNEEKSIILNVEEENNSQSCKIYSHYLFLQSLLSRCLKPAQACSKAYVVNSVIQ